MSAGNAKYSRQNLLVTEEFIQRSSLPLGYFALCLIPKKIEATGLGVCLHLPIPRVVKIDIGELRQELPLLLLIEAIHGIDNFGNSAHTKTIIGRLPELKRQTSVRF
jgi:hypothetical protein